MIKISCRTIRKYISLINFSNSISYYFSAGGIELYAMGGKIKVSNTIEARLSMIFNQILPEIREKLFGVNLNRKYHD